MQVLVNDNDNTVSFLGLSWQELFFIDHILIKTIYETHNKDVRQAAEQILNYCEAAVQSIAEASN